MPRIRTMRYEDIPFAIRLSDQEDWGVTRTDLERILRLYPRGSFVACRGNRRLGVTTTATYGRRLGWIGNVVVDRDHRGERIGRTLIQHAIEQLQKARISHIALYSFGENVRFYQHLGFLKEASFLRLRRDGGLASSEPDLHFSEYTPPLNKVLAADKRAFGADRSALIRSILIRHEGWCLGSLRNSSISSYMIIKVYGDMCEFGPWVCMRPRGYELKSTLRKALGGIGNKPVEIASLRKNRRVVALLKRHGFRVVKQGYRMYLNEEPRIGDDRAQCALGFLDKG